jgi:hypothetical protein
MRILSESLGCSFRVDPSAVRPCRAFARPAERALVRTDVPLAFLQFWWLGRQRILTHPQLSQAGWTVRQLDDLLFYGVLGVIVGGRLGQVLFYEPGYYLARSRCRSSPSGGEACRFTAVFSACCSRCGCTPAKRQDWLEITDFIAPLVPLGLAAGRIGNFINGELWGRVRRIPPCPGRWFSLGGQFAAPPLAALSGWTRRPRPVRSCGCIQARADRAAPFPGSFSSATGPALDRRVFPVAG